MAPTTLSVVNGSVRIAQFPRLLRHVELPSGSVQRLYCRRGKNSQGDVSYSVVAWTGDREVWLASDFEHKRHAQFLERELRWALTRT